MCKVSSSEFHKAGNIMCCHNTQYILTLWLLIYAKKDSIGTKHELILQAVTSNKTKKRNLNWLLCNNTATDGKNIYINQH